jgi:hypothetical protein
MKDGSKAQSNQISKTKGKQTWWNTAIIPALEWED